MSPSPSVPPREPLIKTVIFEALYKHSVPVTPELEADLARAGYDLRNPAAEYPLGVFNACLAAAHRHVHPTLSVAEAHRQLGQALTRGFFGTMVGKILSKVLPLLSVPGYLKRLSQHMKMGSDEMTITPVQVGERAWRIEYRVVPGSSHHFSLGTLEGGLALVTKTAKVRLESLSPERYDLHVTW